LSTKLSIELLCVARAPCDVIRSLSNSIAISLCLGLSLDLEDGTSSDYEFKYCKGVSSYSVNNVTEVPTSCTVKARLTL
jgi:hypothetical protein